MHEKMERLLGPVVDQALTDNIFSGCAVGFFYCDENRIERFTYYRGKNGVFPDSDALNENSIFDLASLTKPLVVSLCLISLLKKCRCSLDDPLDYYFKNCTVHTKNITLYHLLNHCSGLPAHRPYFNSLLKYDAINREDIVIQKILGEQMSYDLGTENLYSDLGFILLGIIISKITQQSIDKYWKNNIGRQMGLEKDVFYVSSIKNNSSKFVSTGYCPWSGNLLSGYVNDDNCRSLGGVAGHAGLFANMKGILLLCENIFKIYKGLIKHPSISQGGLHDALQRNRGPWRFGFDTPSKPYSSSGRYLGEDSIGHLGFTGTSFWIDLTKGIGIVLLTNRVIYNNTIEKMRLFRPRIHDIIMKELKKSP